MSDIVTVEDVPASKDGPAKRSLRPVLRSRTGIIVGVLILLALVGMSYLVGVLRPYSPTEVAGDPFTGLDGTHWMGTDDLGRDYFVRLCIAGRTSLSIAVFAALLSLVVGSMIGLAAGLQGGRLDALLMAGVDLLLSFPSILLALAAITVFSPTRKTLVIVLAVVSIPQFARVVRARCLELREREFILSARISGVRAPVIAVKHLLPNVFPLMMVQLANTAAIVILLESSLSYLGLGVQPPTPSWGRMIFESQNYMADSPWLPLGPAGALLLSSIGWSLIGEGFSVSRRSVV
ncbi:ABC transporter permease [Actinomadura syzygii]|uniref:ABC transporter permease n=1 Tax=Actinomadura syzygii TaxID=1427538 RepID=A0A5D0ULJ1_9ACTN|nr:ABC transporter permease [Actinomadura syzygii]TYC18493.1 ABC transporter permease [Actinomadura syzygii]